jgi:hypothetical protein
VKDVGAAGGLEAVSEYAWRAVGWAACHVAVQAT